MKTPLHHVMKTPLNHEYFLTEITQMLADVLGADPAEISPHSEMVNDLGAESLDFVEFNANLEKRFNFVLPKKGALFLAGRISESPELFYGAKTGLTAEGVELLKHSLSHYTHLKPGVTIGDIFNSTRVENIASLCNNLFRHYLPGSCPDCGHIHARLSPQGKLVCDQCSTPVRPLNGDEAEERGLRQYLAVSLSEAV